MNTDDPESRCIEDDPPSELSPPSGDFSAVESSPSPSVDLSYSPVADTRIALIGRLGGMNRREATNLLRSFRAIVVEIPASTARRESPAARSADSRDSRTLGEMADVIVIGADEPPLAEDHLLDDATRRAQVAGKVEVIHETELWRRLGLVDVQESVRQFYTPAMLSHLLGVSVRVIRRWHRRGLITPVRTLHKLPFFDFQEVATARRLAQWIATGASAKAIEQRLVDLIDFMPGIRRPLDQLSILVEGKDVLLRHGEGLVEPGGQLRFDFDALESPDPDSRTEAVAGGDSDPHAGDGDSEFGDSVERNVLSFASAVPSETRPPEQAHGGPSRDALLQAVFDAEDSGDLERAIEYAHAVLARDGPRADVCFQLAELLYRSGDLTAARERYFAAIEIDPEFVEARASLGDVLAELGKPELAIASFRGALSLYPDYAEVHYSLARVLDDAERRVEADHHWRKFLKLAPESPWAPEAHERLRMM